MCYIQSTQSDVRLRTPFTEKGSKDAGQRPTVHILAGDWNTWMGDPQYKANKHGFEVLLGKNTITSAGNQPYDNFVVSSNLKEHCSISTRVLLLSNPQNSTKGEIGLSDHFPILLELDFTSQLSVVKDRKKKGKTSKILSP